MLFIVAFFLKIQPTGWRKEVLRNYLYRCNTSLLYNIYIFKLNSDLIQEKGKFPITFVWNQKCPVTHLDFWENCFILVLLFHCTLMSRWAKHLETPFFYKIHLASTKLSQKHIIQIYSPDWENRAHTGKEMVSYHITCTSQLQLSFPCQNVLTTETIQFILRQCHVHAWHFCHFLRSLCNSL